MTNSLHMNYSNAFSWKSVYFDSDVPSSKTYSTHWGRVTHICVGNLTIIGSDNGLTPGRRQAITWTNIGILLIGPLWTKFNEMLIDIHTFSFKKIHLKMSSGKWRPFCLGLNVFIDKISKLVQPMTLHQTINKPLPQRPRQNGRHFADDSFKCIFLSEYYCIFIQISLKFVPKGPVNNNPALIQTMVWWCTGNKPSPEPIMA